MATLERIRNRAGILVAVVIGFALLAFILGDMLNTNATFFVGSKLDVAEINGKAITIHEYQARIDELTEIYRMNSRTGTVTEEQVEQIRESIWQQVQMEYIFGKQYDKVGVRVSPEELFDMVQGTNPHPIIRDLFADPETGMVNKPMLMQFLKSLDADPTGNQKTFWLYLEKEIINERSQAKYTNLIRKGLYPAKHVAAADFKDNNRRVDFSFVAQRYDLIPDSLVNITRKDLAAYYKKHKKKYQQTASRDVEYVAFEIVPSREDFRAAEEWIQRIRPDFASADDAKQFVNLNSDVPYQDINYAPASVPAPIQDSVFAAQAGTIFAPILDNGAYKLVKVTGFVFVPDSVKARHILIQPQGQNQAAIDAAKSLADSLKNLLDTRKAEFATLAATYSADRSNSDQGGELGWFTEGMMVKPFNDAAFSAKTGERKIVETNFGIHIIEVIERTRELRKANLAIVQRDVDPSTATYQTLYSKAGSFLARAENIAGFDKIAADENLNKRVASNIRESDKSIPGIENSRELIRWAYNAKKGDVSNVMELGNMFVVATLREAREEGIAPLDQVKGEIELIVRKEKKGILLAQKMNDAKASASNIEEVAGKLNTSVETANSISFSSFSIPGVGIEPKLVASASASPEGELMPAVAGNNAVYLVKVTSVTEAPERDLGMEKMRLKNMYQSRANFEAYEAARKAANIKDMRFKFY